MFPKQTLLAPLRDHSFRPESYKPSCSAPIELWWAAFRRPRWKEPPSGPRGTYSISPQEGKNLKTVTATFRNHPTRKQKSKVTQDRIASLREYHPAAGRHECSVSPPALTSTAICSSNMCFPTTFTYTAVKGKKVFCCSHMLLLMVMPKAWLPQPFLHESSSSQDKGWRCTQVLLLWITWT